MEESLRAILSSHESRKAELIPILQEVQVEYGYLPRETLLEVAKFTRVPEGRVYGVASFYGQFRFAPVGRNIIMVCRGTACHVRGATRVLEVLQNTTGLEPGETDPEMKFSLDTVNCLGCCALGPVMEIDEQHLGRLDTGSAVDLLKNYD